MKNLLDNIGEQIGITSMEDWYSVGSTVFRENGGMN